MAEKQWNHHRCNIISPLEKLLIVFGVIVYFLDIILDLRVAHYMYHEGGHVWGTLILCSSVTSVLISNGCSLSKRYDRKNHLLPTRCDKIIHISAVNLYSFRGYFCPWKWERNPRIILNILSLLQLNPIIDMLELVFHNKQCIRSISLKLAHYRSTQKVSKMLVTSIVVTLQTISLVNFTHEEEGFVSNTLQFKLRIASVLVSCISLSYIIACEERARRFADRYEYDFTITYALQSVILFTGCFMIYVSRVFLVALVYYHFITLTGLTFVTLVVIECHHLFIVAINLIYLYKSDVFDDVVVRRNRSIWFSIPMIYLLATLEIFMVNLRFPVQTVGIILKKREAVGCRSGKMFGGLFILFGIEMITVVVISACFSKDLHSMFFYLCYISIALYIFSGTLFATYFRPNVHPDKRKEKLSHKKFMTVLPITCDVPFEDTVEKVCIVRSDISMQSIILSILSG